MLARGQSTLVVAKVYVSVLGGFALSAPDGQSIHIPNRKARGILTFLAMSANRSASREQLSGLFWSDRPEEQARASLRQTLKQLRTLFASIGYNGFLTGRHDISYESGTVIVDVENLLADLRDGSVRQQMLSTDSIPEKILYGYEDLDASFRTWLQTVRQTTHDRIVGELQSIMTSGAPRDAKRAANALSTIDPANEEASRYLIRHHANNGNTPAALKEYRKLWEFLDEEYDVEPDEETKALICEIKVGAYEQPKEEAIDNASGHPVSGPSSAVVVIDASGYHSAFDHEDAGSQEAWAQVQANIIEPNITRYSGAVAKRNSGVLLLEFEKRSPGRKIFIGYQF